MIFPWLLQAKIQISRQKKYQYLFLRPMYQFVESIVPFHKDFSPSGEQLEHRKLAHDF